MIQFKPTYNVGWLQLSLTDDLATVKVVIFGVSPDNQAHHCSSIILLCT